ncbi:MAG: protein translocase subunit SecD [Actinomycetes bacterium]
MSRAPLVRALLALAVTAAALVTSLTIDPRLGLDLEGGTQIVLETRDSPTVEANAEATDRTLEVLRRRVDALGVAEPTLARSGDNRIIVELPGLQDPREASRVIGRTAQLTFHPVEGIAPPKPTPGATPSPEASPGGSGDNADSAGDKAPSDERILPDEAGQRLRLAPTALTGDDVTSAEAQIDPQIGGWFVTVDFSGGGDAWAELTGKAACAPPGDPRRRVAIVLDKEIISSPQVDPSVQCNVGITGGTTQITGDFSEDEAKNLGLLVQAGALPVPVETVEQRTVGPTLGEEAIDASAKAGVIGVVLTALFIMIVYRLVGLASAVGLVAYGLLSYGALVALGATLTLPGLAGFVLAIGMAVDANVLVYERAREEYLARPAKGLRAALVQGYRHALSAIADSNVTTLLAAALLFFLSTGPVRGFGVTLSIGVLASLISALLVARVLSEWVVNRKSVQGRPGLSGIAQEGRVRTWLSGHRINLMQYRNRFLAASGVALVLALGGIGLRGVELGVEFTGGRLVDYSTSRPVDADTAREAVSDAGFPRAVVQTSGDGEVSVRTGDLTNQQVVRIRQALEEVGGNVTKESDELIGPSLGDELRTKALIALGAALLVQLVYLAMRFRWTFGTAAVAAMFHDVLLVVGVFAWLGKPLDGVFLAALLTVIGYSVNDSVVVFDRIRELWGANRRTPFSQVANGAVLQTVPRTVNTGLGAVFILTALLLLGGDSLADFALALLVGILVGTYSSMFTATPLAIILERYNSNPPPGPKRSAQAVTKRPGQRSERSGSGAVV